MKKRGRPMRFSEELDLLLLRQVVDENPYSDYMKWKLILDFLVLTTQKPFSIKNMRERVNLMLSQFERMVSKEIVTSGVEPPQQSEKHKLLEQVKALKTSCKASKKAASNKDKREAAAVGATIRDTAAMQHWIKLTNQWDEPQKPDNAPLPQSPSAEDAPSCSATYFTIEHEVPVGELIVDVVMDPALPSVEPPTPQNPLSPSPELAAPPAEESTSPAREKFINSPNVAGGPIKRRRTGVVARSITEYMKGKRVTEREIKLKELEVELLKEQNESRRITIQEQQMNAVLSCLNRTAEVLNQFLAERK